MKRLAALLVGMVGVMALPSCVPSEDQGVNDARILGFGLAGIASTTEDPNKARAAALGSDLANRRGDDLSRYHAARLGRAEGNATSGGRDFFIVINFATGGSKKIEGRHYHIYSDIIYKRHMDEYPEGYKIDFYTNGKYMGALSRDLRK